jgi:hypothetical protein
VRPSRVESSLREATTRGSCPSSWEDEVLLQAEAALPEDLVWSDSDSSEEEDTDFFPDPEGGPSEPPTQSSVPCPPPPVSEA